MSSYTFICGRNLSTALLKCQYLNVLRCHLSNYICNNKLIERKCEVYGRILQKTLDVSPFPKVVIIGIRSISVLQNADEIKRILSIPENKLIHLNIINSSDMSSALTDLENFKLSICEEDLIKLSDLTCKAVKREIRQINSLVDKFWKFVISLEGIQMPSNVLRNYLSMCILSGSRISGEEILKLMKHHNISMNQEIGEMLIACLCHQGRKEETEKVVSILNSINGKIGHKIFSSLIILKGKTKDYDGIKNIVNAMQSSNIKMTSECHSSMVITSHLCDKFDEAKNILESMKKSGEMFSPQQYIHIIRSFILNGGFQKAIDHLHYILNSKSSLAGEVDLKWLILKLIHSNYPREAVTILSTQKSYKSNPHQNNNCSVFIKELIRSRMDSSILVDVCMDMAKNNLNTNALHVALEASLLDNRVETSWTLLRALKQNGAPIKEHYFWPLLALRHSDDDHAAKTLRIIDGMIELESPPTAESLEKFVIPNLPLESPELTLQMLSKKAVSVSKAITPLLSVLISNNMFDQAISLVTTCQVHIAIVNLLPILASSYGQYPEQSLKILKALIVKSIEGEKIKKMIPEQLGDTFVQMVLRSSDKAIEKNCQNLTQDLDEHDIPYTKDSSFKNLNEEVIPGATESEKSPRVPSSHSSHPSEMSLEELESHLIELKGKGMNTRGVLRKLLFRYSSNQDKRKLSQVIKELRSLDNNLSPGMMSSLLHSNILKKNSEEAFETFVILREEFPKFSIDSYKVIDLVTLLTSKGKFRESLEIMREYLAKTPVNFHQKKGILRNCHRLLTACSHHEGYAATKEMCSIILDGGLADSSPIIFGPLIKVHLEHGNLEEAVNEAERIYSMFKVLPMRIDILKKLIDKVILSSDESNEEAECSAKWNCLVDKMISLIKGSRGFGQAKQDLLYATVETGNEEEAYRVFQFVESDLDVQRMRELCNFFVRKEKVDCLLLLFSISRGRHKIDRRYICDSLLNIYYVTRNSEAAMSLWSSMQEEGLKPSSLFLTKISKLLGSSASSPSNGLQTK